MATTAFAILNDVWKENGFVKTKRKILILSKKKKKKNHAIAEKHAQIGTSIFLCRKPSME